MIVSQILPVNIKMKTATGEISSCLGQIAVDLKLEKNLIKHKVLIANIPIEGILGMDYLEVELRSMNSTYDSFPDLDLSHGNYCFSNRYIRCT
jgi:hypothetical protein